MTPVLTVNFTFDLLTSKFNRFIFVPNCTEAAIGEILTSVNEFLVYDYGHMHPQPENRLSKV